MTHSGGGRGLRILDSFDVIHNFLERHPDLDKVPEHELENIKSDLKEIVERVERVRSISKDYKNVGLSDEVKKLVEMSSKKNLFSLNFLKRVASILA